MAHLCWRWLGDLAVFNVALFLDFGRSSTVRPQLSSGQPPHPLCLGSGLLPAGNCSADCSVARLNSLTIHRTAELCKAHKRKASIRIFASTRSRREDIRSSGSNLTKISFCRKPSHSCAPSTASAKRSFRVKSCARGTKDVSAASLTPRRHLQSSGS